MALTLDQIKATGIPKNVSKLYNRKYTPAAIPNDSINLYDAIKLAFANLESPTNLSNTPASSTVTVESSTGTDTILPAATSSLAGVMAASDKTNLTSLITLSGVAAGSNNLGTFTGTTISDNGTVKDVLQELETALEANGDGIYGGSGTVSSATTVTLDDHLFFVTNNKWFEVNAYSTGGVSPHSYLLCYPNSAYIGSNASGVSNEIIVNGTNITLSNYSTTNAIMKYRPLDYFADYSADYTTRSLVDKAYVDASIVSGADGNGIYDGSGTVPASTTVTIDDGLTFNTSAGTTPFQVTFGTTTGSLLYADNANAILQYFDAGGTNKVHCKSDGILLQTAPPDQVTITGKAAEYSADYSGGYTDRSLVDKAYVDGKIIAYTPTSSADGTGSTGDVAYDDNYIYVKTSGNGWCRAAISTF